MGCEDVVLMGWISFDFDQVEMADLSGLHGFRFYLRGQASFVNTFVSSLDMLFVMILLSFRRSRSVFLASSASATALISLLGSGSFWKASCLNFRKACGWLWDRSWSPALTDSLVLYGA